MYLEATRRFGSSRIKSSIPAWLSYPSWPYHREHRPGQVVAKTTAAMGTALRAVGQGMRVLMSAQFYLKGSWHYGELDAVQAFGDKFVMKQMGRGFVKVGAEKPDPEDVRMVEEAWVEADRAIQSVANGIWVVSLDETQLCHQLWHAGPGQGGREPSRESRRWSTSS